VHHARRLRGVALAAALVAASATVAADDTDSHVAQSCLYHPTIKRTKVLNDQNILYVTSNGTYNNQLVKQCPGMRRNAQLSYTLVNQKLCAGSSFTLLRQVGISSNMQPVYNPATNSSVLIQGPTFIPTVTCRLGMFLPVTEDEVADLIASTEAEKGSRRQRRRNSQEAIETEPVELPDDATEGGASSSTP
jgi:hypothetical protein